MKKGKKNMAVFWAVCCLFCAAINDLLFKMFNRKKRPAGLFVALIGLIWMLLLVVLGPEFGTSLSATIVWGMISGLFSIVGNLLLIAAMKFQSAGVCSTIYRLNLAGVALGAWLFLDERLSASAILGTFAALAAVSSFFPWKENQSPGNHPAKELRFGILLAVIAAFLRAGMGLSYKYAFLNGAAASGVLFINSAWWIGGGLLWYFLIEYKEKVPLNRSLVKYGLISGILVCGICMTMAESLRLGKASVVLPIAQMSFIPTFLLGAFFLKEKITRYKIGGAILGCLGILLLVL